jgi:hypothetical protein
MYIRSIRVQWYTHSFTYHSFTNHALTYLLIQSLTYLLAHSILYSFLHSFVHSEIHLLIFLTYTLRHLSRKYGTSNRLTIADQSFSRMLRLKGLGHQIDFKYVYRYRSTVNKMRLVFCFNFLGASLIFLH